MLSDGGWVALPIQRLYKEWRSLSVSHPRWVGGLPSKQVDWHRQQADIAQRVRDWFSAAFHLEKLNQLLPEDQSVLLEKRYVECAATHAETQKTGYIHRRFVPPPRNPSTPKEQIDLSSFHTKPNVFLERVDGRGLPAGSQVLNGVPFDIRGEIMLNGKTVKWQRHSMTGIPIQSYGRAIHLLHQSSQAFSLPMGEEIARVSIHYENGSTETFPILRLIHLQEDWETVELSGAEVAALMITTGGDPLRINRRMYHMVWENPHPEWKISTLDAEMGETPANYRLHAITIEAP